MNLIRLIITGVFLSGLPVYSWSDTLWKCTSEDGLVSYVPQKTTTGTCIKLATSPVEEKIKTPRAESKEKTKGRKLTGEECARMELIVPDVARHIGMRRDSLELLNAAEKGAFPVASDAMIHWVAEYDIPSLLKYPYELAAKFGKLCEQGRIRARI